MKKKPIIKVKPVKSYKKPMYPGKELYEASPDLLLSNAPANWLKAPATAGALLAFIFNIGTSAMTDGLLNALTQKKATNNADLAASPVASPKINPKDQETEQLKKIYNIAPLFIHGTGTGATGCVVMSPPVFMPEEEAIEIILSQLKKAGFQFEKKLYLLPEVFTNEVENTYENGPIDPKPEVLDRKHPFYFDLYFDQYKLGIKFISRDNYFDLGGPKDSGSAQMYDLVDVGQAIREKFRNYNKINMVVFYDPLVNHISGFPKTRNALLKKSAQILRDQVNDFLYWWKENNKTKQRTANTEE